MDIMIVLYYPRVVDNEDTTSPSDSITDHSTKTDESPKPQPRSKFKIYENTQFH